MLFSFQVMEEKGKSVHCVDLFRPPCQTGAMKMQSGFTLVEIVVSTLIMTMLVVGGIGLWQTVQKVGPKLDQKRHFYAAENFMRQQLNFLDKSAPKPVLKPNVISFTTWRSAFHGVQKPVRVQYQIEAGRLLYQEQVSSVGLSQSAKKKWEKVIFADINDAAFKFWQQDKQAWTDPRNLDGNLDGNLENFTTLPLMVGLDMVHQDKAQNLIFALQDFQVFSSSGF